MNRKWCTRILQAAAITVTLAAICEELEKPKAERKWHGKVAGFVPYDFRLPTVERAKAAYWNPHEHRVFTPELFGVGWTINFYALLENLRIMSQADVSEESFLMPTESIKDILSSQPTLIET
ncbi:hypothetical protein ACFLV4_01205 [Chloroflexota bacterium]